MVRGVPPPPPPLLPLATIMKHITMPYFHDPWAGAQSRCAQGMPCKNCHSSADSLRLAGYTLVLLMTLQPDTHTCSPLVTFNSMHATNSFQGSSYRTSSRRPYGLAGGCQRACLGSAPACRNPLVLAGFLAVRRLCCLTLWRGAVMA